MDNQPRPHHGDVDVDVGGIKTVASLVPAALRSLRAAAAAGMEERRQNRLRKLAACHRRQREIDAQEAVRKEGSRK